MPAKCTLSGRFKLASVMFVTENTDIDDLIEQLKKKIISNTPQY